MDQWGPIGDGCICLLAAIDIRLYGFGVLTAKFWAFPLGIQMLQKYQLQGASATDPLTRGSASGPVSYTHLTLPTIYSV